MRLVIIETPYAGNIFQRWRNKRYARDCMRDSLRRDEAPFLSHLLYTQVLWDQTAAERRRGIEAGLAWKKAADATVVYDDLGISPGMHIGIILTKDNHPIEYRTLGDWSLLHSICSGWTRAWTRLRS